MTDKYDIARKKFEKETDEWMLIMENWILQTVNYQQHPSTQNFHSMINAKKMVKAYLMDEFEESVGKFE